MNNVNAYDIETFNDNGKIIPYCACFSIDEKNYSYYGYDCVEKSIEMIFYIVKKKKIIYIHNLNYDGRLILDKLSKYNVFEFECIMNENVIYGLLIKKENKIIEFRCSYRLLPISLKKIAIDFNLEKKKMPYPYMFINLKSIEKNILTNEREFFNNCEDHLMFLNCYYGLNMTLEEYTIKYCMNDVEITKLFIIFLKNVVIKYDIDIIKEKIFSISALSAKLFSKKFNYNSVKTKIQINYDDYIRRAYYGGRCEVFGNIKNGEKLYHFDFSGMYGQCMLEKMPNGDCTYVIKPENTFKAGFYDIIYKSKDMEFPILPHHSKKNGKLFFTNGTNRGVYWFEEINLFLENGGEIIEIVSGVIFESFEKTFDRFVEEFNNYRNLGSSYKIFGKLIINSLYGRLGMNIKNEKTIIFKIDEKEKIFEKHDILSFSYYNNIGIATIESKDEYPKYSNIAMSAAITSKARIKLYKAFLDVIKNGGSIKYCDTDSIFAGFEKDVRNEKHGDVDWSIDKRIIEDAVFISPKEYFIKFNNKEEHKIKGISKNYVIDFEKIKYEFFNNKKFIFVENIQYIKNINIEYRIINKLIDFGKYDKRIFDKSKLTTKPIDTDAD